MAFDPHASSALINNQNTPPDPTTTVATKMYHSMSDLGFPPTDYQPLFTRRHLEHKSLTDITVTLTDDERATFNEIMTATRNRDYFPHDVTVRCAGGWVRDKLLLCDSADIDLAVDSMSGIEFAQRLQRYFECVKNSPFTLGKIEENPDKSKHLETATFKINTLEFDVANLRTETYACDSRVPVIEIGSAQEDAMRRDLTINALFYSLNEARLEDWTGQGLPDLVEGVARTPLDALQTYRDDPLRVLRNIRHGVTKLGFRLHDDIVAAAQHVQVQTDLSTKVSRERFSIELEKMLKGENVWIALQCLVKLRLAPILFAQEEIEVEGKIWVECAALAQTVTQMVVKDGEDGDGEDGDGEEKKSEIQKEKKKFWQYLDEDKSRARQLQKELLFAAFTYPFHNATVLGNKKKKISMTAYFVLHSMPGMGKKLGDVADSYHAGVTEMVRLLRRLQSSQEQVPHEEMSLCVGKFLLQCRDRWKLAMQLVKSACVVCKSSDNDDDADESDIVVDVESVNGIQQWIETKSELLQCWTWKPLINGRQLMQTYAAHGLAQDARIGQLLQLILEERLKKPSITLQEMQPKIIAWIEQHPAPPSVNVGVSKKTKKK